MRVLAVTTWLPTTSSPSTGAFVVKDAAAIASLGHDVALVHLVPPEQLGQDRLVGELAGLPVTRIPMSTTRPDQVIEAGRALRPLVAQADLLHTMAFSTLLALVGQRVQAPWVHTEHWSGLTAPQTLPMAWRFALPTLTPLLRNPDVVTAVCDYLAVPIRSVRRRRPTTVVPCVVPPQPGGPAPRPDPGRGVLELVSIGALVPRKDPLLAVDTVAQLRRRGHPARIRFVGQGELADAVRSRAAELGLLEHVDLVGTRERAGVLAELARADLFLGPTRGDNFFVSCAEAVLAGRPVVVGSTGGQGEYLHPDVGITVESRSPGAYAEAVEQVMASATAMSAEQISGTIGERFAPDAVAAGYAEAYDQAHRCVHAGRGQP